MLWLEGFIEANAAGREAVLAALMDLGVSQVELVEEAAVLDAHLKETASYWDYADAAALQAGQPGVRFYLPAAGSEQKMGEIRGALARLKALDLGCDPGSLALSACSVADEDWAESWKRYYHPLPAGRRLLIVPQWEDPPADPEGRLLLWMDPGMVFGSGQHETTLLCLAALEEAVFPGARVLDAGCGSGILSIGSLLLGAGSALAVDVDPLAGDVVHENGLLNGLGPGRLTVLIGDLTVDEDLNARMGGGYDVVVMNIVADVILSLLPRLKGWLKPGGMFIASGIIADRLGDVTAALETMGLTGAQVRSMGQWRAVVARVPGP